jgi:Domain of unknown function DUF11
MRRGFWRTAVLSVAGLAGSSGLLPADEFSPFDAPRYRSEPARTSLPFPPVPNYHQELFGSPRPSARPADPEAFPVTAPQRLSGGRVSESRPLTGANPFDSRPFPGTARADERFDELLDAEPALSHRPTGPRAPLPQVSPRPAAAEELVPAEYRSDRHQGGIRRILAGEREDNPFHTPTGLAPEADAFEAAQPPLHQITAPVSTSPENPPPSGSAAPPAPFSPASEGHALPTAPSGALVAPPLARAESGEPHFPAITLKWNKQGEMLVGQECACELIVRNDGPGAAADLIVEAHFPEAVRMLEAQPQPLEASTHLVWRFESLAAGAEQPIRLRLIPSRRGALEPRALVRFTQGAVGRFSIDEPLLEVALKGPNEVSLGDPASQIVLVSNPGTGTIRNVAVLAHIPAGLENPHGNELALDIGALGPGETRRVRLGLAAAKGGRHTVSVQATAEPGLRHAATAEVTVIAPSLEVGIAGPALRYKGRRATYQITVTNDGTAASHNVRVSHRLPEGFEFARADAGGLFDNNKQAVEWFIERIEAGQSQQLTVELTAVQLGEFVHQVVATTEQGVRAEQQLAATVDGTASLVLEIVDLDDPVEVGVETAYEIRVRNEGSKPASNVGLSCELPQGVELVDAQGPSESTVQNGVVTFRPLADLEDGKTVAYRIIVRGMAAGQHRVRALLASDSVTRPLAIEELTRFYGE